MRLPSYDHLLLNRATHRSCLQKVGFIGQVLFLLFLILALVPFCAYGQIGNLGWAEGAKPPKRIINYYESARFQLFFELGAGAVLFEDISVNRKLEESKVTQGAFFLDAGLGASYRLFLSGGSGPRIELAVHGSVSANFVDVELDYFRLLGTIAPEIGVKLATKGKRLARLFFSFGPALSILDDNYPKWGYAYKENKTFASLWMLRFGTEIGSVHAPFSGIIGIKLLKRGEREYIDRYDGVDNRTKENDLLLMLGIRYRIT